MEDIKNVVVVGSEEQREIKVAGWLNGRLYIGVAKCNPNDCWDWNIGAKLATARMEKVAYATELKYINALRVTLKSQIKALKEEERLCKEYLEYAEEEIDYQMYLAD